jgi:hypothetical protein
MGAASARHSLRPLSAGGYATAHHSDATRREKVQLCLSVTAMSECDNAMQAAGNERFPDCFTSVAMMLLYLIIAGP